MCVYNEFIKFKLILNFLPNFLSLHFFFLFYFLNTFQVPNEAYNSIWNLIVAEKENIEEKLKKIIFGRK